MEHRQSIKDELYELSPELAGLDPSTPYRVPPGYFNNLAEEILLRIRSAEELTPAQELANLSPLLSGLSKTAPFSVPEGYFEQLSGRIADIKQQKNGARVISLSAARVFRYAAAAVTIGLITVITWFFIAGPDPKVEQFAVKQDSAAELQAKKNISQISESEIANYLEDGSMFFSPGQMFADVQIKDEDITLILTEISDQELEKYLDQYKPLQENFN